MNLKKNKKTLNVQDRKKGNLGEKKNKSLKVNQCCL